MPAKMRSLLPDEDTEVNVLFLGEKKEYKILRILSEPQENRKK